MMSKHSQDIFELVRRCGGPEVICAASQDTRHRIRSDRTPYKWPKIGIPEKHWSLIRELCGASPSELHALNEGVRSEQFEQSSA